MDKEERKRIHKKISLLTLLALVIVVVIMIGGTFMGWLSIRAFQLIACLYLVGYWAVTDVLEPKLTKLLEGVTEDQKTSYKKYAAMDFAGYMGILVFVIFAGQGGASNVGMWPVCSRKESAVLPNISAVRERPPEESMPVRRKLENRSFGRSIFPLCRPAAMPVWM